MILNSRNYKLTIGIPTWNRKEFLAANLEHLFKETVDQSEVEILVSDNASDDGTEELCRGLRERLTHFSYFRNPTNLGANFNFQNVIQKAQGNYVWLLGDDDKIVEGSVSEVLKKIGLHPEIDIIVGGCIHDQTKKRLYPPHLSRDLVAQTELLKTYDAIRLASKISTLVFKKDSLFKDLPQYQKTIENLRTPWPHLVWWLSILEKGGKVLYLQAATNYYLESSRYNMLQDGVTRSRIMIQDYALLVTKLKEEGLISEPFFQILKLTMGSSRKDEFFKIAAYSTFLNGYGETLKSAFKTLRSIPGMKNKLSFGLFYCLPIIFPVWFRKMLFRIPCRFTSWTEYQNFIHYLDEVKQHLASKKLNARSVFDEKGL